MPLRLQTPCPEHMLGHNGSEQSLPVHSGLQIHVPGGLPLASVDCRHWPFPEQFRGHIATEQSRLDHGVVHWQVPRTVSQIPCSGLVQLLGHRAMLQSSPMKPSSHMHPNAISQIPCPEHSLGHGGTSLGRQVRSHNSSVEHIFNVLFSNPHMVSTCRQRDGHGWISEWERLEYAGIEEAHRSCRRTIRPLLVLHFSPRSAIFFSTFIDFRARVSSSNA